jgi:hypothetical protein
MKNFYRLDRTNSMKNLPLSAEKAQAAATPLKSCHSLRGVHATNGFYVVQQAIVS